VAGLIDVFASAPWYVDHLAPIWLALPPESRGTFHVSPRAVPAARGLPGFAPRPLTGDARRPVLVTSYGDLRAARMVGRTRIALGQHGAGQSYSTDHPAYPGGRNQGDASLFLVPNDTAASRTRRAYPKARVEVVGCPKLDTLAARVPSDGPVIAFSFHWDGPNIAPEMQSAWQHYRAIVPVIAQHFAVIGHAHPRAMGKVERWYRSARIEVVPSFCDILRRADVYVCDNSSSLFEFAATGRPVVALNSPAFRRDVEHGLRFWAASGVGVNVDRPSRLAEAITLAIEDPPEVRAAREAALDIVYRPRSGGASLAASALMDWAR
jgi:hypothetical protein